MSEVISSSRPEPFFIAGSAGLDFLNSIATPVNEPVEWLATGDDLLDWLHRAQLLPGDVAAALRESAAPEEIDAVAAQARALREWFRAFVHAHRGKPLKTSALEELEPLNHVLARGRQFEQIEVRTGEDAAKVPLQRARLRRYASPDALLLPIAEALADVVCNANFADIRACEGSACSLLYVDRTGKRSRRWCSMAVCGNRSKQATHRVRASRRRAS